MFMLTSPPIAPTKSAAACLSFELGAADMISITQPSATIEAKVSAAQPTITLRLPSRRTSQPVAIAPAIDRRPNVPIALDACPVVKPDEVRKIGAQLDTP